MKSMMADCDSNDMSGNTNGEVMMRTNLIDKFRGVVRRQVPTRIRYANVAYSAVVYLLMFAGASASASAQQVPVTGTMMDTRPDAQQIAGTTTSNGKLPTAQIATPHLDPDYTPAALPPPGVAHGGNIYAPRVGDVTTALLQAQADGRVSAPPQPMLGAAAGVAYKRYVDSFSHAIPEFFQQKLKDDNGSGS